RRGGGGGGWGQREGRGAGQPVPRHDRRGAGRRPPGDRPRPPGIRAVVLVSAGLRAEVVRNTLQPIQRSSLTPGTGATTRTSGTRCACPCRRRGPPAAPG